MNGERYDCRRSRPSAVTIRVRTLWVLKERTCLFSSGSVSKSSGSDSAYANAGASSSSQFGCISDHNRTGEALGGRYWWVTLVIGIPWVRCDATPKW
jgi:hypothetical protein